MHDTAKKYDPHPLWPWLNKKSFPSTVFHYLYWPMQVKCGGKMTFVWPEITLSQTSVLFMFMMQRQVRYIFTLDKHYVTHSRYDPHSRYWNNHSLGGSYISSLQDVAWDDTLKCNISTGTNVLQYWISTTITKNQYL